MLKILEKLKLIQARISSLEGIEKKPNKIESCKGFCSRSAYAFKLMFSEKEIFFFALLQWIAVAVGYFLWVQILYLVPEEVWQEAEKSDDTSAVDLILIAWTFICIGVATFPLGLFSACIGAVHFLRRQGKKSTIFACLKLSLPRVGSLWFFTWLDGWITVKQIISRLEKEEGSNHLLREALYYAWKFATMGILPGLISGRSLSMSAKNSIILVKDKMWELAKLRAGYSFINWIVATIAFLATIVFFIKFDNLVPFASDKTQEYLPSFYFWAGIPIMASIALIQLLIRPLYIISLCDIYSDMIEERNGNLILENSGNGFWSILIFIVFIALVIAGCFYHDELGISELFRKGLKL